ncbi:cyclic nucleotide-binding domain-containing thioredoxin-disulfide reductase [Actinoplanes sp. M2I2]|jgi:thioredoxin reductase (NADPH)|uniref:FAD-dependent oxidoreductase n=1 Tax=Actinoplanes sp. M2I2 TaxID=1734444 RepID=UPI0020210620|nr:cyclic nucleotide-binding domain-containing thioredoxin-disulfide reductase [Actinoplanes sp. M2I2]
MTDVRSPSSFPEIGERQRDILAAAGYRLTDEQSRRTASYGVAEQVAAGQVLSELGDANSDLLLCGTATLESLRTAAAEPGGDVFLQYGPGQFAGELNLFTGQTRVVSVRAATAGTVWRIDPKAFRRLMGREADLADIFLRAALAKRRLLRQGAAHDLRVIGDPGSRAGLALRTFLNRQGVAHAWLDPAALEDATVMAAAGLAAVDLPAVITGRRTLRNVTTGALSEFLGLSYRRTGRSVNDLVVVGAGPAGLAAAVYGSSEGLATVLLDAVATGGQAATSARIENYLGFPFGLRGADLAARAAVQALKFGTQIASPCAVAELQPGSDLHTIVLADGTAIRSRAVVVATGAEYRSLPLARWDEFTGNGIYYAATDLEAQSVAGMPVAVVGGANSAGQAALQLSRYAAGVTLLVRGPELGAAMSAYLVDRIRAEPRITVRTGSEVARLHGVDRLAAISVRTSGTEQTIDCGGLFCFIGAVPATSWLTGVALDHDGFVRTDQQLDRTALGGRWSTFPGGPLPLETSVPGVFAAGDVRSGSMKRVAAAVGEGSSAVRSVHQARERATAG